MRCGDCRYWGKPDDTYRHYDDRAIPGVRVCGRLCQYWDATDWKGVPDGKGAMDYVRVRTPETKNDLAFCNDGSSYHAELLTLPDFYCAHFEDKVMITEDDTGWPSGEYVRGDIRLKLTSSACPEQYDAYDGDGNRVGHLRLRHGYFSVECPDVGEEEVLNGSPDGDGMFYDTERHGWLDKAIDAINEWRKKQ